MDKTINAVTENLVTSVVYEPFGPVSDFTYGNGLTMTATFDQNFDLDQLQSSSSLNWVFGYDDTGNILTITDQVTPVRNQTFTYDDLYRLDTALGGYGNEDFDYDANGNRERYLSDVVDDPYSYEPQTNRLATQNGWTFSRDATGNRTQKLGAAGYGKIYSYGDHSRLVEVVDRVVSGDTVAATYVYDGHGRRVIKYGPGPSGATYYMYGLNGELLGEYDGTGLSMLPEYAYLNGQPIASVSRKSVVITPEPIEVIIDNGDLGTMQNGIWVTKTDSQSYGPDFLEAKKKASNTYTWSAMPPGILYKVYAWWVARNGYADQVEYTIGYGFNQTATVYQSHKTNGGQWNYMGEYYTYGISDYVQVNAADGKTAADAIKMVYTPEPIVTLVESTSFLHTDHLGAPRAVTDNGQTVVWRWDSTPFGNSVPNEDPDGDSNIFSLDLRFPGQYYDAESGLYYNYFRTYDPEIGRYIESDPIGLAGGLNTFGYAIANPLRWFDSTGLEISCTGTWQYVGFNPQVPRLLRLCSCYWLCVDCNYPTAWSGVKENLPSTTGSLYFDPNVRGEAAGDIEGGNACICANKPGSETGCKEEPCDEDG